MALTRADLARPGRRSFLRAAAGTALAFVLPRPSFANERASQPSRRVLVCVNLVGGLDGLSVVVPYGEDHYYRARPHLAIPPPSRPGGALPLIDGFGLHPGLTSLHTLYREEQLCLVPAAGGAHFGRSHFEARHAMHHAVPSSSEIKAAGAAYATVRDGWANRYAQLLASASADACLFSTTSALPLALSGSAPAETEVNVRAFASGEESEAYLATLDRLYADAGDPFARSASRALHLAAEMRDKTRAVRLTGDYGRQGAGLREAARLIRADVGARVIWVEISGFDTHKAQGAVEGALGRKLAQLGQALSAFRQDLGPAFADVTLVTLTEFGRMLRENGAGGTDHGSASCMLVLGGRVRGGRLVGAWPGIAPAALHDGRELTVTTDYRAVLADVLSSQLGVDAAGLQQVFPGLDLSQQAPLGLCVAD
jgi:uncharacterized protein (DUF1501 family)